MRPVHGSAGAAGDLVLMLLHMRRRSQDNGEEESWLLSVSGAGGGRCWGGGRCCQSVIVRERLSIDLWIETDVEVTFGHERVMALISAPSPD